MGLSFLRGLVAAVNPCGFILLPTYLMYFLGMQGQHPGSQRAIDPPGLVVSAAVSAGFLTVFLAGRADLGALHAMDQQERPLRDRRDRRRAGRARRGHAVRLQAPDLHAAVGCRRAATHRRLDVRLRVAYAVASIGCTIGLFLATLLGSTRSDGVMSGVANVVAYGAGMALVVTALTITLAVANTGLLRVLRTGMRHVESIAAVFVVLSGLYLVYYFWVVDVNEDAAPITNRVEDLQNWIIVRLERQLADHRVRARARSSPPRSCT